MVFSFGIIHFNAIDQNIWGMRVRAIQIIGLVWVISMYCFTSGLAQDNIREFVQEMNSDSISSDRMERIIEFEQSRTAEMSASYATLLKEVVDHFLGTGKPEKALTYVNSLAQFYIFGSQVNHHQSREVLDLMQPHLNDLLPSNDLLTYHELSGELDLYQARSKDAIVHFEEIIRIGRELRDTVSSSYAYAHLKLGEIHSSLWDLMSSIQYFNQASQQFLNLRDSTMFLWCQSGLATLFGNNGLYNEADRARAVIFEKGVGLDVPQILAIAHTTAGIEKDYQGLVEEQLAHLRLAEKYSRKESQVQTYVRAIILMFLTNAYAKNQQVDSAQYYFEEFKKLYDPITQGEWIENHFNVAEASVAFANGHYQKAEQIVLERIRKSRANDNLAVRIRLYSLLIWIYKDWDQKELGFEAMESYQELRDSLDNIRVSNRFLYFTQMFESERKDKEILRQQASINLLSERNKVMLLRLLITVLVLSALFVILYLRRSRNFAIQTTRLRENYSHALLARQEDERKRIAMELHDGISQQLILIKNQLDQENNPEISKWVSGSLEELRHISKSLHPEILKNFGLFLALDRMIERLKKSTELKILKEIDEIDYQMSESVELHIYRIIQELTNNAIRHSRASRLVFRIKDRGKYIQFEVEDNGIGIDPSVANGTSKGIGLNSIRDRARMIGAELTVKSVRGAGTHFILIVYKNE